MDDTVYIVEVVCKDLKFWSFADKKRVFLRYADAIKQYDIFLEMRDSELGNLLAKSNRPDKPPSVGMKMSYAEGNDFEVSLIRLKVEQ